ncbi:MAG: ABC transporter substrate-binding protein [Chloroflexi bacterium]|nr:ABC transporter substrate-binding protein [Chloroflexota bacterium]
MKFLDRKRRLAALALVPALLIVSFVAACGETVTETVIQTVVVEKEVVVEREGETVVQTVVVEKEVVIEKEGETVVQTVVVEKEVPVEVLQTVVVEKEVVVEKAGETVVQTVVVEKEVEVEVPVVQTVIVEREADAPSGELVTGNPQGTMIIAEGGVGVPVGYPEQCVPGCGNQKFRMGAYETLLWLDSSANAVSRLATDWTVADDQSWVDFDIRRGVQFHNGYGEMTAEDVAWSFNNANPNTNPDSRHDQAGDFRAMATEFEVIDPSKVRMHVNIWEVGVLRRNLSPYWQSMGVHSKKVFDEFGPAGMVDVFVGTGPFVFETWSSDDRAVLNAQSAHWRKVPEMARVEILAVPEAAVRKTMLETGQAHAANIALKDVPGLVEAGFAANPTAARMNGLYFGGNYWQTHHYTEGTELDRPGYDTSLPWVGEYGNEESMQSAINVRQALAAAVDREGINAAILNGLGYVNHITNLSVNSQTWAENAESHGWAYNFDREEAKRLMNEAGWGDGFEVTIWTGVGTHQEIVEAIAAEWLATLNVRVSLDHSPYSEHRPNLVNLSFNQIQYRTCGDSFSALSVDLPKSNETTSHKIGGTICAASILPRWDEIFDQMTKELDRRKRTELAIEHFDYAREVSINVGVNEQPAFNTFDGTKILDWPIPPQMCIGGCGWFNLEEVDWAP